jgi:hypothetical protein
MAIFCDIVIMCHHYKTVFIISELTVVIRIIICNIIGIVHNIHMALFWCAYSCFLVGSVLDVCTGDDMDVYTIIVEQSRRDETWN